MTHHERFVREILWPVLMTSNHGMTRQDIERDAPGIRCAGFIPQLLKKKHGKPILEEVGEQDGRSVLKITPHSKKKFTTLEKAIEGVANRIHKCNRVYYKEKAKKQRRKSSRKKKQVDTGSTVDLASVISGKMIQEKINGMKAEVLDVLLKGPGVRDAVLAKLKVKAFAWEQGKE